MKNTKTILTKDEIKEMFHHINVETNKDGCDGTLKHTKSWLKSKVEKDQIEVILKEIQDAGGYCDCEVLMNASEALLAD